MSKSYEKLITLLKQMYQMDQADLDFGIYRIMNYKREEIEKFLNEDLLPQVSKQLEKYISVKQKNLKEELEDLKKTLNETGVAYENSAKYVELKNALESGMDIEKIEEEVYSHLTDFFSRYYNNGDFISQRRYKQGIYAIPYEGEEVKLYWANADQYYIKTTEHFKDYTFTLPDNKRVHFKLVEASTEQDNNKPAKNKERRFVLCQDEPVKVENGELIIQFDYKVHKNKQKDLNDEAIKKITEIFNNGKGVYNSFLSIFTASPTEANPNRTLLEKHLNDYTARNTFDYFIHKDLGGFLRRELDFYLKNEVMFLDDLDTEHEIRVEQYITKIKVIKNIGYKIIAFLEQIENFQKKLWLKKKFVVETNYCITLDRIDEEFYSEIAANKSQVEEWKKRFAIDKLEGYSEPLTVKFLKANPYLVLDTAFFGEEFKEKLIQSIDNMDEKTDGLLIKSENFQALNLLLERYKEQVKCVYIDPPFNSPSSEILYKNNFKHSSWLSLMYDRIKLGRLLLTDDFVHIIAIDENEQEVLGQIISNIFPENQKVCVSVVHNPRGQQGKNVSYTHEFAYFIYPNDEKKYIADIKRNEVDSRNLRDSGTESDRADAATCFYPFLVKDNKIIGVGEVPHDDYHPISSNVVRKDGIIEIWPIDDNGCERKWRYSVSSVSKILDKLEIKMGRNSLQVIFNKDTGTMKSLWADAKYDASEYGTKVIQSILGVETAALFSYPKSIYTVEKALYAGVSENPEAIVLDYFAGSGTTAHAVINLNREDGGSRKYILVEMGEYFDTVLKPRIQKVIYSKDWRDGKPVSREGISHMFKYMKLESYEDALNNLEIRRSEEQQGTLDLGRDLREQYMLSYMLGKETEGSMSLLNVDQFANPFEYKLKIANGLETKETAVDLVETFNYLLGLVATRIDAKESFNVEPDETSDIPGAVRLIPAKKGEYIFKEVEGHTLAGDKVLIIWRTLTGDIARDNAALDAYFKKKNYNTQDFEYDCIYVNGDNNLQCIKQEGERWKVLLIEEEFKRLMFDAQDV